MTKAESPLWRFLSPRSAADFYFAYGVWACAALILTMLEIGRFGFADATMFWAIVAAVGALCGAGGAWIGKLTGINVHAGAGFAVLAWLMFSLKAASVQLAG